MRSGLMRDFVTIQRNSPSQGPSGEEIDSWADHINTWMWIRETGGDESIHNLKANMRYADVVHTDRIIFGSRTFDIVSVSDTSGMARYLVLELAEDTSGG